ncbi:MAG: hypothetical protein H0X13_15595 [Ramlibacter sp.]|nr:hypothetical protein [Ramlibacter sp.]
MTDPLSKHIADSLEAMQQRNTRVKVRYDELMAEGKRGHYECLFAVAREEVDRAALEGVLLAATDERMEAEIVQRVYRFANARTNGEAEAVMAQIREMLRRRPALSQPPVLDGWQPIETAPTDPKALLVWCPENKNTYAVVWDDGAWQIWGYGSRLTEKPTHWQPLPPPPVNNIPLKD